MAWKQSAQHVSRLSGCRSGTLVENELVALCQGGVQVPDYSNAAASGCAAADAGAPLAAQGLAGQTSADGSPENCKQAVVGSSPTVSSSVYLDAMSGLSRHES